MLLKHNYAVWFLRKLSLYGNMIARNWKKIRVYNICTWQSIILQFAKSLTRATYILDSNLVFPAVVENEIVSGAISSLSLLPTHG